MSSKLNEQTGAWRGDIEGLRAVAVLSVLIFHATPLWLPGGFIGVDIFFVISGYLISSIILREVAKNNFSLIEFYLHRARRIFPALSAVIIATVGTAYFLSFPFSIISTAKHGAAGALSVLNIVLWLETGYFDTSSHLKPFLNLWSLGVEEQFYLIWPILLVFLVRRRWLGPVPVLVICTISFIFSEWLNTRIPSAVFYLPVFRAWELGAGALTAMAVLKHGVNLHFFAASSGGLIRATGLFALAVSMFALDEKIPFPGLAALPVVCGTAAIIWAGSLPPSRTDPVRMVLEARPMRYIGRISYSLYLWHWPLLSVPLTFGLELDTWSRLIILVVSVALASITFRWVEAPARLSINPRAAAIKSTAWLFGALCLCVLVYFNEKQHSRGNLGVKLDQQLSWPSPSGNRDGCPKEIEDLSPGLAYCKASNGRPSRIVWGDSHADHLFPGLVNADASHSWLLLGHMSCPPVSGISVSADQPDCRQRSDSALNWILKQDRIDTVVLGFFSGYIESSDFAFDHQRGAAGPSRTLIDGMSDKHTKSIHFGAGLESAVRKISGSGKRVVLVIDVPELPFNPGNCHLRQRVSIFHPICSLSVAEALGRQAAMRNVIDRIKEQFPRTLVVDPLGVICQSGACVSRSLEVPIYRDSHHLSASGSELVGREIVKHIYQDELVR